ncbi:MAG: hypothetical protein WC666_03270 [Candidatus Paceibacterota bacterium]|jgi:hypothetical protein
MNKVLAKNGVRHNMEVLFNDLQQNTKNAFQQTLLGLIETYGIMAEPGQDGKVLNSDTSLKASYTTAWSINIASGYAITSDLGFINVPTTSTTLPAGSGIHTLYIKQKTIDSNYSTIMNGFNFNPGETIAATRQFDSYEFIWDVSTSGIVIADVSYTDVGVVYTITDRRHENLFTLRSDVVPAKYVRTDWTDIQTIASKFVTKDSVKVASNTNTNSIEFKTTGTEVGAISVDAEKVKLTTDRQHIQGTDSGTTSQSFKIGVGSLGPSGVGLNALTEPDTPSNVKNFRIVDISGGNNDVFYGTTTKAKIKPYLPRRISELVQVTVAWGYDGIVGTGGASGTFSIDHTQNTHSRGVDGGISYANATFTLNELVGHWIHIPVQNTSYKIIGNTATNANVTVLSVTTAGGSVPNLTGINTTSAIRGSIHNGCDTYNVRLVPVLAASTTTEIIPSQRTVAVTKNGTLGIYAALLTTFTVPATWLVNFYITAASANLVNSGEVTMSTGSYYKPTNGSKYSNNPISYAIPVPVELPSVVTGTTAISAVSTPHGFAMGLSIDSTTGGWDLADEFEYVYTTDNAGADFANPKHERRVTSERFIDVPATGTRTYSIKVRPLLCGQAIGSTLSTSVVSGSGGQSPNDVIIVQTPVDLQTYIGTITADGGGTSWTVSNLRSPATQAAGSGYLTSLPTGTVIVSEATIVTADAVFPPSTSITLTVGDTASFPASGTVYLYRESATGVTVNTITYTGKTSTTLLGAIMTGIATSVNVYIGDLITLNSTIKEYLVHYYGGPHFGLVQLSGASAPITVGAIVGNVTKRGRMLLYQAGVTLDYLITRGYMDCDILVGTKARLRWFQNGVESSNDSLLVSASNTPYYQDSDATLYAENENGVRTLIIDAYDDTFLYNASNLVGTFTLYGRPRSIADQNFEKLQVYVR